MAPEAPQTESYTGDLAARKALVAKTLTSLFYTFFGVFRGVSAHDHHAATILCQAREAIPRSFVGPLSSISCSAEPGHIGDPISQVIGLAVRVSTPLLLIAGTATLLFSFTCDWADKDHTRNRDIERAKTDAQARRTESQRRRTEARRAEQENLRDILQIQHQLAPTADTEAALRELLGVLKEEASNLRTQEISPDAPVSELGETEEILVVLPWKRVTEPEIFARYVQIATEIIALEEQLERDEDQPEGDEE